MPAWNCLLIFPLLAWTAASTSYLRVEECDNVPRLPLNATDNPRSPLLPCHYLPMSLLLCDDPIDLLGNATAKEETGLGCTQFGVSPTHALESTSVVCRAMPCVECRGSRTFLRHNHPCIRHNGHYFVTTLLYSIFLGWLAVDRFTLGYTAIGVGKMITMGGVGVWWLVDVLLLLTGHLMPHDGSSWQSYY